MKLSVFLAVLVLSLLIIIANAGAQTSKTFKVTNKSGMAVTSVRLASNDTYTWGLSLTTMDKVPIDKSFDFVQKIDTARCIYDFKFTGDDGKDYIIENVDLCSTKEIVLAIPEEKDKTIEDKKGEEKKEGEK
ncbi:MAG TPA: hypothetical protein VGK25_10390 [Ignavibacteria bacterium]|jgi:hypothetical protein